MKTTWHFTIPDTLLLPATDQLAGQQGLEGLRSRHLEKLLVLFQTFSAYSDLPLGLNPRRRKVIRQELNELKANPSSRIKDIAGLVKKIKMIKEQYQQRKQKHHELKHSHFSIYEEEDLIFIATRILKQIEYYVNQASTELKHTRLPQQHNHPLNVYCRFIQKTQKQLQQHQEDIAENMLQRLELVDAQNDTRYFDLKDSPPREIDEKTFMIFHRCIYQYGNASTQERLRKLSWLNEKHLGLESIIKPKRPRKPSWLFRGNAIRHQAFANSAHQVRLLLSIRKTRTMQANDTHKITDVIEAHKKLTQEIRRLKRLYKKTFPWIHRETRSQIRMRINSLQQHQQYSSHLQQSMQERIDIAQLDEARKQARREEIARKTASYNADIAEKFFHLWIENPRNRIVIDGIDYQSDPQTIEWMHASLKSPIKLQAAIMKKFRQTTLNNLVETHQLIQMLGTDATQYLWANQLDQYRFYILQQCLSDPDSAPTLADNFIYSLRAVPNTFPTSRHTVEQIRCLLSQYPTKGWTLDQHRACEAIAYNPLLSLYYRNVMLYCLADDPIDAVEIADAIIQTFSDEQLLEIEFPELTDLFETLSRRRIDEKQALTTADLFELDCKQGQIDSALSRLTRLTEDLQSARPGAQQRAVRKIIIAAEQLSETETKDPDEEQSQLIVSLRTLLDSNTKGETYLEKLSELQQRAERLPCLQKYVVTKRLCKAGHEIPLITNTLPNKILALVNNEITHITEINPLLLNIIEFDLIPEKQKLGLGKLIAAILTNPSNLNTNQVRQLQAIQKGLLNSLDDHDRSVFFESSRKNTTRLQSQTLPLTHKKGTPDYARTLRSHSV